MGQHPSKVSHMAPIQNYPVYVSNSGPPIHYVDVPAPYPDDPRSYESRPPFPPPFPMFVNNDFVLPPPQPQQPMNYPQDPPRRGGYRGPPRGQRGPPPRRGNSNPPPRGVRRGDDMDERNFFRDDEDFFRDDDDDYDDDDIVNLPDFSEIKSKAQNRPGGFDPFVENPRLYTREQLEKGGAREIIDNVRQRARQGVEPARRQNNPPNPTPPRGDNTRRFCGRKGPQNPPARQGQNQGYGQGMSPQPIMLGCPQDCSQPTMPGYKFVAAGSCYPQPSTCYPQAYLIPT